MPVSGSTQLIGSTLEDLSGLLETLRAERVILVVDQNAVKASNAGDRLRSGIGERLCEVFDEFTPNPSCDQPLRAAQRAVDHGVDTIVAFGGGSCMDVAKVGALAAARPDRAGDLVRGARVDGVVPLNVVAIPTTSGTGSEATHFSAVYVDGRKVSIANPGMRPRGVILDPSLHMAMPSAVAAVTGLDALCQATESLWAVAATPESSEYAAAAQMRVIRHLSASVRQSRRHDREQMMHGAHEAGRAINISKTTAAHALSYELTTRFGIAHGLGVALTLGHVAAFNAEVNDADCNHPLGPAHARLEVHSACRAFGVAPVDMPERLQKALQELDLPTRLREAGVTEASLEAMAGSADTIRLSNNPRRLSTQEARTILRRAF